MTKDKKKKDEENEGLDIDFGIGKRETGNTIRKFYCLPRCKQTRLSLLMQTAS